MSSMRNYSTMSFNFQITITWILCRCYILTLFPRSILTLSPILSVTSLLSGSHYFFMIGCSNMSTIRSILFGSISFFMDVSITLIIVSVILIMDLLSTLLIRMLHNLTLTRIVGILLITTPLVSVLTSHLSIAVISLHDL